MSRLCAARPAAAQIPSQVTPFGFFNISQYAGVLIYILFEKFPGNICIFSAGNGEIIQRLAFHR